MVECIKQELRLRFRHSFLASCRYAAATSAVAGSGGADTSSCTWAEYCITSTHAMRSVSCPPINPEPYSVFTHG